MPDDNETTEPGPMKTQALVVADDPVYVSWLQNAAGQNTDFSLLRPLDAEDLMQRAADGWGALDMVFFQFDAANVDVARRYGPSACWSACPELPASRPRRRSSNPDIVLAAMRAGARDFLACCAATRAQVAAADGRAAAPQYHRHASPQQKQGTAVRRCCRPQRQRRHRLPSAEHLALATLAAAAGERAVLLVDVATPPGAGAIFLNINQPYSVLDADQRRLPLRPDAGGYRVLANMPAACSC